jgi:SAM-dependent methyltransferase
MKLRRIVRDNVARFGLSAPALWVYRAATAARPATIVSNARIRRHGAPDELPIPPDDLVFLVSGSTDLSWFLRGGALAAQSVSESLSRVGVAIGELDRILDFGCGCGRVLRYWKTLPHAEVFGTDNSPGLAKWSQQNLPFADIGINDLMPPLSYQDNTFDLIYALSVFTHLTEQLQRAWVSELTRVLKPGGYLVLSTHGDSYLYRLSAPELQRFSAGELVVKNNTTAPGSNTCSAYHPVRYVREHLAAGLENVDFLPQGALGNPTQDLYVLRKPQLSTS